MTSSSYTPKIACTYTTASTPTYTGNSVYSSVTALQNNQTCEGSKYGGN